LNLKSNNLFEFINEKNVINVKDKEFDEIMFRDPNLKVDIEIINQKPKDN